MCVTPLLVNVSQYSNPHVRSCPYCHKESSFDAFITMKSKEEVAPLAWWMDNIQKFLNVSHLYKGKYSQYMTPQ